MGRLRGKQSELFVAGLRQQRSSQAAAKASAANPAPAPVEDPAREYRVPAEGRAQPKEVPSQAPKAVEGWYLKELKRKIEIGELPPMRPWYELHEAILRYNRGWPYGMPR